MNKSFACAAIFFSGVVAAINLEVLLPHTQYQASWGKVILCLCVATYAVISLHRKKP